MSEEVAQKTQNTAKPSDVEPTLRQKRAFNAMVENGGNKGKALIDSGYSPATAKTPKKVTETKGWKILEQDYLGDQLLAEVHNEGLKATKPQLKFVEVEEEDEEGNTETKLKRVSVDVPDHKTRQKFLDIAYKVRGMYPREDKNLNVNLFSMADFATKLEKREQMGLPPIQADAKVVDVIPMTDNDTTVPTNDSGREEKRREEK
jgi:hypothetical protein